MEGTLQIAELYKKISKETKASQDAHFIYGRLVNKDTAVTNAYRGLSKE